MVCTTVVVAMVNYDIQSRWYKEADFLQPEHVEAMEKFQRDWPLYTIGALVADNHVTHHLGETAFQTLLHIPADPSDQVIAVPMGYGTGFKPTSIARAIAIRDIVDPHAALVVQTNMGKNYKANNFSASEVEVLKRGDFTPMRDRLNVALENVASMLPDAKVAYAGGSLGAAVVASVLGRNQAMVLGSNGGTIVDPANVEDRNFLMLGSDYVRDAFETVAVGASNFSFEWIKESLVAPRDISRPARPTLEVGKVAIDEAFNLARALSVGRLAEDVLSTPKEVGLVHMWSRKSNLSSDKHNLLIAEQMSAGDHPLYQRVRIMNPLSRHGVTAAFALQAAALERAMELSGQEGAL